MSVPSAAITPQPRRWLPWLVGVATFAVYAAGACPTIYVGDSGELVAAVHLLGIPHPSGYPLYVLLGKLWTLLLPAGSIAWRMSLFSAAAMAGAAALLCRLLQQLGVGAVAAAVGAGLFAFAPSVWGEANVQRVYALNALFVVAATGVALAWRPAGGIRPLVLAAFLCGLGASNHTFMGLAALAIGLWALLRAPRMVLGVRPVPAGAGAFALGLLPYAYLPLRSRQNPALDWGDPETLDRFLAVLTRRDFWERRYLEGAADLLPIAGDWLASLLTELAWVGLPLAVLAVLASWRAPQTSGTRSVASPQPVPVPEPAPVPEPVPAPDDAPTRWRPALGLLGLLLLINLAAMALHGSRSDLFIWHRYYIPSYAALAVAAGLGAELVRRRLPRRARPLLLVLPAVLLLSGWRDADRSRYRIADDYSRQLLAALPPGSHLAATDDNILFVLIYLHWVERVRPDVDLILQGVGDADLPALRFDPDTDPLFFTHSPNWNHPQLDVVPVGLAFRVVRRGAPPPPTVLPAALAGADDPRVPKDYLTANLIGQFHYMRGLTLARSDWPAGARELARALAAAPDNDVLFYNVGLIRRLHGDLAGAIAAFERSAAINPRAIAGKNPVYARDQLEATRELLGARSLRSPAPPAPSGNPPNGRSTPAP